MSELTMAIWGLEWRSNNVLDGERKYLIYQDTLPCMFKTRREARCYLRDRYGYIRTRPDLRVEPHGWKMPRVTKLIVKAYD